MSVALASLDAPRSANVMQQRWCESLLARMPPYLTLIRAYVERSRAWLVANPTRPLHTHFRERLCSYEARLDAEEAALGLEPKRPPARAKKLTRQLELPVKFARSSRVPQTQETPKRRRPWFRFKSGKATSS